jgi:hypothetical protein
MKISIKILTCLLLTFFSLSIIFSCNQDEVEMIEPDPIIKQVDGLILNKIDGSPISGVNASLANYDFFTGDTYEPVHMTTSNQMGQFTFTSFPEMATFADGTSIWLSSSSFVYQINNLWKNGEQSNSSFVELSLNSNSAQEIIYELYPQTYFKLRIVNVDPVMDLDTIKLDLDNWRYDFTSNDQFQFTGVDVDEFIESYTRIENILTINYEVITDTVTQEFSRIIECSPGEITEVLIEY